MLSYHVIKITYLTKKRINRQIKPLDKPEPSIHRLIEKNHIKSYIRILLLQN